MREFKLFAAGLVLLSTQALANDPFDFGDLTEPSHYIEVKTSDRQTRTMIAEMGYSIDEIRSDAVFFPGDLNDLRRLREVGLKANAYPFRKEWATEQFGLMAERFISTDDTYKALADLQKNYAGLASLFTIGKSVEGRDILIIRLSSRTVEQANIEKLPVVYYTGCHHAREHLSVEIPLRFAKYMLENYGKDPQVTKLLDTRELYISPIINPDGHKYDYRDGLQGRMWRKNRAKNPDGSFGVDLNRNYGFQWGTGGSSTNPTSDVFMGPAPFSEPETRAVKSFIDAQPRMTALISFHTFSELVLYPWGHTYDDIGQKLGRPEDLPVFKKIAENIASWNKYTPEQASDLYIASGDTTDYAYGAHGIFAYTFELSPSSMFGGGFYPSPSVIEPVFAANVKPMLYMLDLANDPSRALREPRPTYNVTPTNAGLGIASFDDLRF